MPPAARIGDLTAHGGTIVTGEPTVLVGGKPAARVTDIHLCPPVHVTGPIIPPCAPMVLIGGQPAARLGDLLVCGCGVPGEIIVTGDFTVLIGNGGSSSSAATAGQAAKVVLTKSNKYTSQVQVGPSAPPPSAAAAPGQAAPTKTNAPPKTKTPKGKTPPKPQVLPKAVQAIRTLGAAGFIGPGGPVLAKLIDLFPWDAIKPVPPPPQAVKVEVLPVPHRTQVGGTCGISASGMIMDYWKQKGATAPTPSDKELIAVGNQLGITSDGKAWTETLAPSNNTNREMVVETLGYEANQYTNASLADLRIATKLGRPAIVAIPVDFAGDPSTDPAHLDRNHAVVIKGVTAVDGKKVVVATHGWDDAVTKVWPAEQFDAAWAKYGRPYQVIVPAQ